jgi:CspA family cold shock protein
MSKTGKVKFFNEDKGFGFITEDGTGTDHFVHISGVKEETLHQDDEVSFELVEGRKGLNAVNVTLI